MNENKQMDISPKSRSIRQIPLSKKTETELPPKRIPEEPRFVRHDNPPRKRGWSKFAYLAAALLLIFAVLMSTVFSAGKLVVTPRNETVPFDSLITAKKTGGELSFETMTIDREGSKEVKATGEAQVEDKASGQIVIYNKQAVSQKLIANTRFESNGLVFRIKEGVTVPARKSAEEPGSLQVTVYADQPGDKYNIGLSDFTLPALKGSAQYDNLYARSKTPMTGGFVGLKKNVADADKQSARAELKERLKSDLFKEAASSKTDGYALFTDAIFVKFENLPDENSGDNVLIKEKATLYGIIFEKKAMSKYIAEKTISSYAGEDVLVSNLEDLDFTTQNKESIEPWNSGEITFNLMGNPTVVWQFDENKLRNELSGKLKKEARAILTTYPAIERAEISLRPFWNRSFPANPEKIKIVKKLDKKED